MSKKRTTDSAETQTPPNQPGKSASQIVHEAFDLKRCCTCKQRLPHSEFHKNRSQPDGLEIRCRACVKESSKKAYERHRLLMCRRKVAKRLANPEEGRAKQKEYRDAHKDKIKLINQRACLKRYGLTIEQFLALVEKHGNRCAICGNPPPETDARNRKNLNIDHDHLTGTVRGLLCLQCNVGIGNFSDDPEMLRKAADYLESHACAASSNSPNQE